MGSRHTIEFELEGSTMSEVEDRMAEICNHYFGVGQWDYSLDTFRQAGSSPREAMSWTNPRFRSKVTAWSLDR